jgi:hypothetical protein
MALLEVSLHGTYGIPVLLAFKTLEPARMVAPAAAANLVGLSDKFVHGFFRSGDNSFLVSAVRHHADSILAHMLRDKHRESKNIR